MEIFILLIFGAITNTANCVLVIHSAEVNGNKSLVDFNVKFFNDNLRDTVIDIVAENFVVLNNIRIYMKIDFSLNRNDQFDTTFVNTVIDLGKLLNGVFSNPIIQTITDSMLKNINFKPKFPFKQVSRTKFR